MLLFSKRMKLAEAFNEYANKHHTPREAFDVITWLHGYGLLNDEKCNDFLAMKTSNSMDEVETSEQNQ